MRTGRTQVWLPAVLHERSFSGVSRPGLKRRPAASDANASRFALVFPVGEAPERSYIDDVSSLLTHRIVCSPSDIAATSASSTLKRLGRGLSTAIQEG